MSAVILAATVFVLVFMDAWYEASFHWQGMEDVEAYFGPFGPWVKSEFPLVVDRLPENTRTRDGALPK